MDKDKLKDTIWTTRISRVNAESRLLRKNSFIQGVNIYYSCVTIIFSILTLIENNYALSLITVFMTISLLVTILYLNSLKYSECAKDYRSNYTMLYKLELELSRDISEERIRQIEIEYCDLLDTSCNHIAFDYYCTMYGANDEFRKNKWNSIRHKYYFGIIWRFIVKVLVLLLPIALYFGAWWYNASV